MRASSSANRAVTSSGTRALPTPSRESNGLALNANRFFARRSLATQLAEIGLDSVDIDYIARSHSHFDHAGNANQFVSATWLVDEAERAFMFRDETRSDPTFSYYSGPENAETIAFNDDYDVFGDGTVTIMRTPGHTPGHTSLLVRLSNEGPVLLSGDLYHFAEARTKRTVPVFNTDPEETQRSMARFESLASATGARVIVQHDPEHFAALPVAPGYLD
jgi:glyoxylase-like metal-dependent hydrolase (beta-lactamase superfamily II)